MSKANKIRSLLALKGIKSVEYSRQLGLSRPQALNTKYYRDAFTSDDLIRLAELTGTRLTFIDPATREPLVVFESEDLKEKDDASRRCSKGSPRAEADEETCDYEPVGLSIKL